MRKLLAATLGVFLRPLPLGDIRVRDDRAAAGLIQGHDHHRVPALRRRVARRVLGREGVALAREDGGDASGRVPAV